MVVENLLVFQSVMLGYAKPPPNLQNYGLNMVVENLLVFLVSYVGLRKASTQPTSWVSPIREGFRVRVFVVGCD
jgi:hypothetical protein